MVLAVLRASLSQASLRRSSSTWTLSGFHPRRWRDLPARSTTLLLRCAPAQTLSSQVHSATNTRCQAKAATLRMEAYRPTQTRQQWWRHHGLSLEMKTPWSTCRASEPMPRLHRTSMNKRSARTWRLQPWARRLRQSLERPLEPPGRTRKSTLCCKGLSRSRGLKNLSDWHPRVSSHRIWQRTTLSRLA